MLRLLGRLKATEVPRHGQLLTAATARDPALAAAFLVALPWALDPKPSTQWLAAATLTGQVRLLFKWFPLYVLLRPVFCTDRNLIGVVLTFI